MTVIFLLEPACRYLKPSNFTRTPLPCPWMTRPLHHGIKAIPVSAWIQLVIFFSLTFTPSFHCPKYMGIKCDNLTCFTDFAQRKSTSWIPPSSVTWKFTIIWSFESTCSHYWGPITIPTKLIVYLISSPCLGLLVQVLNIILVFDGPDKHYLDLRMLYRITQLDD